MSRKLRFAKLKTAASAPIAAHAQCAPTKLADAGEGSDATSTRPVSREGRKQIAGFFTPEVSFAMHMLAHHQGRSLQALMAEGSTT